jgi:hypothetical protein
MMLKYSKGSITQIARLLDENYDYVRKINIERKKVLK